MLDSLVNRPNTIVQRQKLYQSDLRPVYQRGPRSGFYMKAYLAIFAVGMVGTAHGLWNSAWGKKVESAE